MERANKRWETDMKVPAYSQADLDSEAAQRKVHHLRRHNARIAETLRKARKAQDRLDAVLRAAHEVATRFDRLTPDEKLAKGVAPSQLLEQLLEAILPERQSESRG